MNMLFVDVQYTNARDCEAPRNAVAADALMLVRVYTLPRAHQQAKEMACMRPIMASVQQGHDIIVTERQDTGAHIQREFLFLNQLTSVLVTLHRSERVSLAHAGDDDSLLSLSYF